MELFLMQHGEAQPETVAPERPLTDTGRVTVDLVARKAGSLGVRVGRCFHSGKLRAEQTAIILMDEIGDGELVEARSGLGPNDPVAPAADWLRGVAAGGSVAVVGHLPFLDRLASLLVAGDEEAHVIAFRNAGLVKLHGDESGFAVDWALTPDLAG